MLVKAFIVCPAIVRGVAVLIELTLLISAVWIWCDLKQSRYFRSPGSVIPFSLPWNSCLGAWEGGGTALGRISSFRGNLLCLSLICSAPLTPSKLLKPPGVVLCEKGVVDVNALRSPRELALMALMTPSVGS